MTPDNYFIAEQFSLLSKLMDIHGENSFKSKNYSIAAFNIEKLPMQLNELEPQQIFALKGIGESTGKKILEIVQHGSLAALTDIIRKTPQGVLEMLSIKGIGPKKIATIWKEMEIESPGELLYACTENRLARYKGFGEKSQQSIAASIGFYQQSQGSQLFAAIERYALALNKQFNEQFPADQFELTGAFRRHSLTIEKLEWVTTAPLDSLRNFALQNNYVEEESLTETLLVRTPEKVLLEFYIRPAELFHATLFETTASVAFLEHWKTIARTDLSTFPSEKEIFAAHRLNPIPPFLREKANVISRAATDDFHDLIQPADIKGIIHSHSTWSDGSQSIEQMVAACIEDGYEYLVISDHSKSAAYANGLTEDRIREQHREIDALNQKFAPFRIFKSIESDILGDGSLDYSDRLLSTFDLVIASVHSNLKMPEEKAMMRLLNAIRNPFTTVLGHMTGRLLLSRPGYPVDHRAIIDACAESKVAIEINANPRRLDMDWEWIDYALQKNVLLSINPDAHETTEYRNCRYGVLAAQKAGLTARHNLSSFSLEEFLQYLSARRVSS